MRIIIPLILTVVAFAEDQYGIDLIAMGISHHTNRDLEWNERNPGLGLSIHTKNMDGNRNIQYTFSAGAYKDSFFNLATYAMPGIKFNIGEYDGFHGYAWLNGGYINGSLYTGIGVMPIIGVGYNRFDLCFTGLPSANKNDPYNNDPPPRRATNKDESGFVAVFVKINLATW